jgi:hypothetical protein
MHGTVAGKKGAPHVRDLRETGTRVKARIQDRGQWSALHEAAYAIR